MLRTKLKTTSQSLVATAIVMGMITALPDVATSAPFNVAAVQRDSSQGGLFVKTRSWHHGGWHHHYRRHHHLGVGRAIGLGIASAIIGGAVADSRRHYRDEWQRCDDAYNSFRWSDGTFQPYGGGPRELCPYLRG